MSEQTHLAAVIAALNAGGCNAYDLAGLKALGSFPPHYTEVHVAERYSPLTRGDTPTIRFWRIVTRAVSTSYFNAQQERANARTVLEGARLLIDGHETTIVERDQSDDPIGPDENYYSGVSMWRYTH